MPGCYCGVLQELSGTALQHRVVDQYYQSRFSSAMMSVQRRVSAQKHTRTVSVQIALCGPDFYTRLYGPP